MTYFYALKNPDTGDREWFVERDGVVELGPFDLYDEGQRMARGR